MTNILIKHAKYIYNSQQKPVEVILQYKTYSELLEYLEDAVLGREADKRLKDTDKFLKIHSIDI